MIAIRTCFPFLVLCLTMPQVRAGLRTIETPQGGKVTFGSVDGQTTEAGAMAFLLRSIHNQSGDRPQVSRLFQVRGTQSVAAFFAVNQRNQGKGQLAGLLIVTKVSTGRVEAAVLSDDAARFNSTMQPLMKTLFSSWHPFEGVTTTGASSAASLRRMDLRDRSASVALPEGWSLAPASGGGTIVANGPRGENVSLGVTFLVADLNNPNVRQTYATVQRGGLRNSSYASGLYYPSGGDLARTFVDLLRMYQQRLGLPVSTVQVAGETRIPSPPNQSCAHITGEYDWNTGKGRMEMNLVFCAGHPSPRGSYMTSASFTTVPLALAGQERSTMGAILASFNVNMGVVQGQAHAFAAPAIEQIHLIGIAAAAQAAAAHQANEIHNSSVYQRWDDLDKRSQEFSNYQLGYTVIHDIPNNAHGTFWNADADELVKRDPQRFEYVNAPDFWKGIDY